MSDLILAGENSEPKFERIGRFQAIVPGQYVRAREELAAELILDGEILPIADVDYVDNAPHTVRLRAHPRHYGMPDKRSIKHRSWTLTEHVFLVRDFMAFFEPATQEEARARRSEEQLEVQASISRMQAEMHATQASPTKMAAIIAEGLAELRKGRGENEPSTLPAVTDGLPPLTLGTALSRGVDETSVMQLRQQAQHQHDIVSVQAKWLQKETTRIAETIKALTPYYTEQGEVAMATAKDMQAFVKKIFEGIKSLDLYLGKEVFTHQIRKGRSAPDTEPLTIVQRKLVVTEELAVFSDVHDNSDYRDISKFLNVLAEQPALVDQIFPTPRSIVCMAATRYDLHYEGASGIESAVKNMQNRKVFFLVRNGENIHYLISPVESHLGASRLFPTKNDVDSIFTGLDGSAITFESLRYTSALNVHEAASLHYKRLLILLCGLDNREKLFGEFYPGEVGLSFVSMEFQQQYMRFIADDDESGLIASNEPRAKPVMEWLKGVNRYLTSGSRVFGVWSDLITNEYSSPGGVKYGGDYRGESDVGIPYSGDLGPCIERPVVTGRGKERNVKIYPGRYRRSREAYDDSLHVPFLVLDSIEPETLHFYIHDRQSRIQNVSYIRLFKRALAYLNAERAQEQPVRALMLKAIVTAGIAPELRAESTLAHAIRLWRAANRGAALPLAADQGGSAWNEVLDVAYLIEHAAGTQLSRVTEFAAAKGYAPVRLSVTGKARLVLYVEPFADERDDRITPHAWLKRIVLQLGKNKITEHSATWERLRNFDPDEHEVAALGDATYWLTTVTGFKSLKAKREIIEACDNGVSLLRELATSQAAVNTLGARYLEIRSNTRSTHKMVPVIGFSVPVGLVVMHDSMRLKVSVITAGCSKASNLIYNLLDAGPAREEFKEMESSAYASQATQSNRLERYSDRRRTGTILSFGLTSEAKDKVARAATLRHECGDYRWAPGEFSADAALTAGLKKEGSKLRSVWLGGGLAHNGDGPGFDDLLGISADIDGYAPGALWVYVGEPDSEYLAVYAEIKGDDRTIHMCSGYEAMLQATWLTEDERDAVFEQLHKDWPSLLGEADVEKRLLTGRDVTQQLYMKR